MSIIPYLLQFIFTCQSKEHTMPQVCALATSKVRQGRHDPRLGLPSCPSPRTSPVRAGGLGAALLHGLILVLSRGSSQRCAPHPLPWAPTGLCCCPVPPVPWKGIGNGSWACRECVWTPTHRYRQKWNGGKAPVPTLYREGEQRMG